MVKHANSKKYEVAINLNESRPTPQAPEIEKAVLGALMIDKDAYDKLSDNFGEDCFHDSRNKIVFNAIKSLKTRNLPADVMTVSIEIEKMGLSGDVPPYMVAELTSRTATSSNIEYHSKVLEQKAYIRKLIEIGAVLWDSAYNDPAEPEELHQKAEQALFDLALQGVTNETVDLITSLNESIKAMQAAQANPDGITGVPTGFEKLDNITAGFQPTDLIILAGRPSMGKTSLAVNMAFQTASMGIPVAFFTLEMSHVQLTNRIISSVCEIPGDRILRGMLTPEDWERIDKRVNAMNTPLYIDDTESLSIFQLRSKARCLIRTKGVKIIFIDYLQLMTAGSGHQGTRQEEVSIISRALKALAKELEVPVVALAQLNRGVESREGLEGKRPQLSDLRESGSIEQDADMVLFVNRPEYYHIYQDENGRDLRGKGQIIIAKHRKGKIGDVLLSFKSEYTRFEDPDLKSLPALPASGNKVVKKEDQEPFPQGDDVVMAF